MVAVLAVPVIVGPICGGGSLAERSGAARMVDAGRAEVSDLLQGVDRAGENDRPTRTVVAENAEGDAEKSQR